MASLSHAMRVPNKLLHAYIRTVVLMLNSMMSACSAVRTTVEYASRPVSAVCRSSAANRRRPLPPAVRWKTSSLDLAYFEVAVVEPTGDRESASSMESAALEVCWHACYQRVGVSFPC